MALCDAELCTCIKPSLSGFALHKFSTPQHSIVVCLQCHVCTWITSLSFPSSEFKHVHFARCSSSYGTVELSLHYRPNPALPDRSVHFVPWTRILATTPSTYILPACVLWEECVCYGGTCPGRSCMGVVDGRMLLTIHLQVTVLV